MPKPKTKAKPEPVEMPAMEFMHPMHAEIPAPAKSGEWLIAGIAAAAGVGFLEPGTSAESPVYASSHTCFAWAIIVLLVVATVWYLYLFFHRLQQGDDMLRVIFHSELTWLDHVPYFCAFLAVLGAIITITGYFLVLLH